ncbi:MAG: PAS domain-containing protein [Schwartzia sp.]|nr:PAS domain-containing protein [Schwartzia sp. (in: firmicutes)]
MENLQTQDIHSRILSDMAEGILTIQHGCITYANPAALGILRMKKEDLLGHPFVNVFMENPVNDGFNQLVLEAIYDKDTTHESIVDYRDDEKTKQLHVKTSFLRDNEEVCGIIIMMQDISELVELKDAVKNMRRIEQQSNELALKNRLLYKTFGRFLPDKIVHKLVDTPGGLMLGGQNQRVTVMMSDLRGFTALTARMKPDELIAMLNNYLKTMTDKIEQYGGAIIEFLGDGILALFGLEPRDEKSTGGAEGAVAAAIAMQSAMEEVNRWNTARGFEKLSMGIGIHTDELVVGLIGSMKRMKYSGICYGVNIAGRIESYTVGGQVLISSSTMKEIKTTVGVTEEQTVYPKGATEPLQLFQVCSIGSPYDLAYEIPREDLTPLKKALPVTFRRLFDKHIEPEILKGSITALSRTGALLSSEAPLEIMDNIELDLGGKAFAKIIKKAQKEYRITFTALPPALAHGIKKPSDCKTSSVSPSRET